LPIKNIYKLHLSSEQIQGITMNTLKCEQDGYIMWNKLDVTIFNVLTPIGKN